MFLKRLPAILSLALFACAGFAQVTLNPVPSRSIGQARQLPGFSFDTAAPNLVEGRELFLPAGIALDTDASPPVLYMADTQNNRILVWLNALSFTNGKPADRVIGQINMYQTFAWGPGTTVQGTTRSTWMRSPSGLRVRGGDLYVVDSGNNRVLRFRKPLNVPADQQHVPDLVIGQTSFNTKIANAPNGLVNAKGIALATNNTTFTGAIEFDAQGNIWLTDAGNARVLRFPASAISGNNVFGPDADMELGQLDYTSVQATPVPGTDVGRRTKNQMNVTTALNFDKAGRLYVADYDPTDANSISNTTRVLVFEPPFTPGKSASRIMGVFPVQQQGQPAPSQQAIFSQRMADVQGIFFLPGTQGMGLVDALFNRVLLFDAYEQWPDEATSFSPVAKALVGHATGISGTNGFDGKSLASNDGNPQAASNTFSRPQAATFVNNELFVADTSNNRMIVMPLTGNTFGPATRVLGQDRFDTNAPNLIEGREFQFLSFNAANSGLALDTNGDTPRLYVADTYNHRVLGYRDARRLKAGKPYDVADIVIGQPDMQTSVCNYPTGDQQKPTQTSLCLPIGLAVDSAGNLYVADSGNGRVVRFPAPFSRAGSQTADVVLGQSDFTTRITDPSSRTMSAPYGVAFAGSNGLLVSDAALNRVLFIPFTNGTFTSSDNGKAATKVFGQQDFTSSASGNSDTAMNTPRHISSDTDGRPYVVDTGNGRVMIFDQINNTASTGAHATYMITGLNLPTGINVNPNTGEIWVAELNSSQVRKYPKYDTLIFRPTSEITPANAPLAVIQDQYGDVLVAEATNRVSFYFPGLASVNAANFIPRALAPNTFGTLTPLTGGRFAPETATTPGVPLPKVLADTQVLINETAAPLHYVSPGQINFIVPWNAPTSGAAEVQVVRVSTGQVVAAGTIQLDQVSPGIFYSTSLGNNNYQAAVINAKDGTVNGPTNPVARGDYITIFATGQGMVSNPPADGDVPRTLTSTPYTPRVGIGACFVDSCAPAQGETVPPDPVQFSGLSPEFPGLWQINVRVPMITDVTSPVPVVLQVNSVGSTAPNYARTVIYVK
jgi:uncharacterized protein (TIGR03437 family)